jgi:hypothetical protein
MVERIAASGVTVLGDLESLTAVPPRKPVEGPGGGLIPPEVSASLAISVLEATGRTRESGEGSGRFEFAEPADIVRIPTYQVAGVLALRARRSVLRRWRSLRGR